MHRTPVPGRARSAHPNAGRAVSLNPSLLIPTPARHYSGASRSPPPAQSLFIILEEPIQMNILIDMVQTLLRDNAELKQRVASIESTLSSSTTTSSTRAAPSGRQPPSEAQLHGAESGSTTDFSTDTDREGDGLDDEFNAIDLSPTERSSMALTSPPHSVKPCASTLRDLPPLHIAARVGNTEIAAPLLDAGADPAAAWDIGGVQALHVAAQNGHRDMVKLLLNHGAPIDERFGSGAFSENTLHSACAGGNLDVVKLLLQRGADSEYEGHYGGPLGFAVHHGQVDVAEFLLENGADPNATVPLFVFEPEEDKGELPPAPHTANFLYVAMDLPHPPSQNELRRRKASELKSHRKTKTSPRWKGLPLSANKKLMALLMAYGARKDATMTIISTHLASFAEEALCAEHEYLATISKMLKGAEDAIPGVFGVSVEAHFRMSTGSQLQCAMIVSNFLAHSDGQAPHQAAQAAFDTTWGLSAPGAQRGELLRNLAGLMERARDELAALEALNNDNLSVFIRKTFNWAKNADVPLAIQLVKYNAGWVDKISGQTIKTDEKELVYTRLEPIGVVGQIIALLLFAMKVAPTLAAGNTIVIKPSESTPLSALLPPGVVNVVTGYGATAGAAISAHMGIGKVVFTGSRKEDYEGRSREYSEAGGKSPSIIFDNADLDSAVGWAAHGLYWNHGAVCCAGSRIFVQSGIHDEFQEKFTEVSKAIRIGDAFGENVDQGPMSSQAQFDRTVGWIQAVRNGRELGEQGVFNYTNVKAVHVNLGHRM
ncbi:Aldehyde/histidinol dehydrogenase [Mycena crocata]|nr:Aldehyde/histidinol dehydrogenase [Mycena crocata]